MSEPDPVGFRTLGELEAAASRTLPAALWDYVQGGAGEERTVRANRAAFQARVLRPRVRLPIFVAPTAYQGSIHPEGEAGTARGAADWGALAVFSTLSSQSLEAIAEAAPGGPRWFQLYLQPDRSVTRRLVERAETAGYRAIVLTVDV